MDDNDGYRLPRGPQVYDAFIGARVGALVGALLGAILTALTSPALAWFILVGAPLFGAIGYFWERRRIRTALTATASEQPGDE